ncbi:MAG: LptE family protein [Candidatus Omnitrophota bacterium]
MTQNSSKLLKFIIMPVPVVLFIALIAGCGYTTRSMISNKYKTIYITPFINKIDITSDADTGNRYRLYYPRLETDVTRSVINKFLFDGNLKPVKEQTADLVLKGEVTAFRKDPVSYNADDDVTEYRISVQVNISLWDVKEKKLLWQENNFTGEKAYFTTGSLAISEGTAVNDTIADLSRRIVERAVEQW